MPDTHYLSHVRFSRRQSGMVSRRIISESSGCFKRVRKARKHTLAVVVNGWDVLPCINRWAQITSPPNAKPMFLVTQTDPEWDLTGEVLDGVPGSLLRSACTVPER